MTDFLQAQQSQAALKSSAPQAGSVEMIEKITLLEKNIQALTNREDNIHAEIKAVKTNVESVKRGFTAQIHQINVCINFDTTEFKMDFLGKHEWNVYICQFMR